ncbi:ribonuclease P protein subunit p29 [Hypoxylon sp. FL1857]|nr:ribonuclease P protein subunit p29 [Hypoxylon sp. FL1857]
MASSTSNPNNQSLTHELLSRAHSPDSTNRIFSEKIQHRPLFLKPTSPPPSNARDARRKARAERQQRAKALKPKPLSARQRRSLGLYNVPKEKQKYAIFEPLNRLWLGYIREILGSELYSGGQGAAAKLSAADFHGAEIEVSRCGCPSRVGVRGIVFKEARNVFTIITKDDQVKTLPKEGSIFRISVAPPPPPDQVKEDATVNERKPFTLEIIGNQFLYRSADRATKKFKQHYLKDL